MTVVLRGVTWEHERGHGSVVAASEAYTRLHPDVRIEWEARSLQSFADQPIESMAPHCDLLVIDHPHAAAAAAEGLLLALDDVLPPEIDPHAFVGRSHESYRYRGGQYGLATDAAAQVAASRPDLIGSAPATWADVLDLARDGRVLWPSKPIDAFSSVVTTVVQHGGEIMSVGERFADAAAFTAAWELLLELRDLVPERCLSMNPIEVAEELAGGDRFAYSPLLFGYTNYSRPGYRGRLLRYVDIPVVAAGEPPRGALLGGAGIAVSAFTAHPEAATDFAVWLASADTQSGSYFEGGGQPGHVAAWENPELNARTADFFSATRRTLEGATLRPRHPDYIPFQDQASVLINHALREREPAGPLLDSLDHLFVSTLGADHADR